MGEHREISDWGSFLLAVVLKPTWEFGTTGVAFTILAVGTWWRDNFAPEGWKHRLELRVLGPHWNPAWWVCVGLAVLLLLVVRESHRLWKVEVDTNTELRRAEDMRRSEPLPPTAPQVTLVSETAPELGKISRLLLRNLSPDPIFNLSFQPVKLREDAHVTWLGDETHILEGRQSMVIEPVLVRSLSAHATEFKGVAAVVDFLRQEKNSPQYDIGPVSFTCEDGVQNRYLVTFAGNRLIVKDCERIRTGSRPSVKE
jgi:hypothetical protein